jgi:hypothetical protein
MQTLRQPLWDESRRVNKAFSAGGRRVRQMRSSTQRQKRTLVGTGNYEFV